MSEGVASVTRELTLRKMDNETVKRVAEGYACRYCCLLRVRSLTLWTLRLPCLVWGRTRRGGNPVNGVTRWTGVPKAGVQFRTGGGKSRRILSMKFTGAQGGLGLIYAELAGSSRRPGRQFTKVYERDGIPGFQHAVRGQGKAFNEWDQEKNGYQ